MTTIFDEVEAIGIAKGEARGEARGKAEGEAHATVTILRDLVAKGILSVDAARDEVRSLIARGALPESVGLEAISRLG